MKDQYGRTIEYMRISITDRCNLRCQYCMPNGISQVPMGEILSYEEIETVCLAAVELGITRFKITGGEPLVRLGCPELIGKIKQIPGVEQVTLTTNGVLLGNYLDALEANGLDAVNISLDTLNRENYKKITGFDELEKVKQNIDLALQKRFPVKINVVLQKGVNDGEWKDLVELARDRNIDVRFIEMMPVGYGKQCQGVSADELLQMIQTVYTGVTKETKVHGNGPAVYYKIPGFQGSVGFISAIHGKFCNTCNRIRLTSTGELKPCLCFGESVNLKPALRKEQIHGQEDESKKDADTIEEVRKLLKNAIEKKPEEHCFESVDAMTEERQMVQIGG